MKRLIDNIVKLIVISGIGNLATYQAHALTIDSSGFVDTVFGQFFSAETGFEISVGFGVINDTPDSSTFRVVQTVLESAGMTQYYFCWGEICYLPEQDTSFLLGIAGGDTTHTFKSYVKHSDQYAGTSRVRYCFYNTQDNADSLCHTFVFKVADSTITRIPVNKREGGLARLYPVPANDRLVVDFIQANSPHTRVDIQNVQGRTVFSKNLRLQNRRTFLDVSTLSPGLYNAVITAGTENQVVVFVVRR